MVVIRALDTVVYIGARWMKACPRLIDTQNDAVITLDMPDDISRKDWRSYVHYLRTGDILRYAILKDGGIMEYMGHKAIDAEYPPEYRKASYRDWWAKQVGYGIPRIPPGDEDRCFLLMAELDEDCMSYRIKHMLKTRRLYLYGPRIHKYNAASIEMWTKAYDGTIVVVRDLGYRDASFISALANGWISIKDDFTAGTGKTRVSLRISKM